VVKELGLRGRVKRWGQEVGLRRDTHGAPMHPPATRHSVAPAGESHFKIPFLKNENKASTSWSDMEALQ
jgi:hypothetical protein